MLDELRARFKLKLAEPTSSTDATPVTRTYEVLLGSDADRIDALSNSLTPHLAGPAKGTTRTPSLALPKAATGTARVSDAASGLYVDVQPAGLAAAPADVADGYVVYASARSPNEHLLRRITADGVEDFENFESAPASPDVAYDLALSPKVAGLRLVGNSLEFLDSAGAPRLRVPSPYLVDTTGARIDATLAVTGCNVDTSPAAPWGRAATTPGAAHCTMKVSWDGSRVKYPALLDPSWTTTGSMPNTQADHKGVLLQSGKTLVIGPNYGHGCFLYDPPSGTWSTTGSPVRQRSNAMVAVLQDGRVLLAGGYNGGTQNTAELYNPASGTWSSTGTMVSKIEQATENLLANGKVLVAGGFRYVSSTNRNYTAEAEQGSAITEGLGHFFASKLMNNPTQADCTFVYYKEVYNEADPEHGFPPPYSVACSTPKKWMEDHCPPTPTDVQLGSEWDWLTALYAIHTDATYPYPMADLGDVFRYACTGSRTTSCAGQGLRFNAPAVPAGNRPPGIASLADGACKVATGDFVGGPCVDPSNPKYLKFRDLGQQHGVDH